MHMANTMVTLGSARGMHELVHTGGFRGDAHETYTDTRREQRRIPFHSTGKKKTGARFALYSLQSLWGETRLLLRNVISMSSYNEPDNAAV